MNLYKYKRKWYMGSFTINSIWIIFTSSYHATKRLPATAFAGMWYGWCRSFPSWGSYFKTNNDPYSSPIYLQHNKKVTVFKTCTSHYQHFTKKCKIRYNKTKILPNIIHVRCTIDNRESSYVGLPLYIRSKTPVLQIPDLPTSKPIKRIDTS